MKKQKPKKGRNMTGKDFIKLIQEEKLEDAIILIGDTDTDEFEPVMSVWSCRAVVDDDGYIQPGLKELTATDIEEGYGPEDVCEEGFDALALFSQEKH